jgi:hypothetical protein
MMDPNAALEAMRQAIKALRAAAEGDSNDAEIQAGHDVADYAEGLDEWLCKGGFLPDPWTHGGSRL